MLGLFLAIGAVPGPHEAVIQNPEDFEEKRCLFSLLLVTLYSLVIDWL